MLPFPRVVVDDNQIFAVECARIHTKYALNTSMLPVNTMQRILKNRHFSKTLTTRHQLHFFSSNSAENQQAGSTQRNPTSRHKHKHLAKTEHGHGSERDINHRNMYSLLNILHPQLPHLGPVSKSISQLNTDDVDARTQMVGD